ncbi:MAG: hypothetical protein R3E32_14535 [Chitinophagales bacterium]
MNNPIDINKILNTIDTTISELKEGIQPSILSNTSKSALKKDMSRVIRLALKIKLQHQQRQIEGLIEALDTNEDLDLEKLQETTHQLDVVLLGDGRAA